jgi:hypothetical protein
MITYMQQLINSRFLAKAVSYLCVSKEVLRSFIIQKKVNVTTNACKRV